MMIRKLGMAVAVASAFAIAAPAQAAQGVLFDINGGGGAGLQADVFNWIFNATLAKALFPRPADGVIYGQAELDTISNGVGVPAGRFTYQFAIPVSSADNGNQVIFEGTGTTFGPENYFRMYFDPTPPATALALAARRLSGLGYGDSNGADLLTDPTPTALRAANPDQTMILDAKVSISASGANYSTGNQGVFVPLGTPALVNPRGTNTISGSGNVTLNIDVCTAAEVGDAAHPSCSVVSTFDTNFWRSEITSLTIDFELGDGIKTAANAGVPIMQSLAGQTPDFGAGTVAAGTNNYLCSTDGTAGNLDPAVGSALCDMYYSGTNAILTTEHEHVVLPEPGTMLLLGLGLGALGLSSRRRRQQAA